MSPATERDRHTDRVRDYFSNTSVYLEAPLIREVRLLALQSLGLEPAGARILDAGCGDGTLSLGWAGQAAELTLVDFSPAMLAAARCSAERASPGRVRIIEGDFMTLDLGSGYDIVLCLGVLAHLPSLEAAMARLASFTRESGFVVVHLTDADGLLGRILWVRSQCGAHSRTGYRVLRLGARSVSEAGRRHGLCPVWTIRYSLILPGLGRLPERLLRAVETASLRSRALGRFGSERIIVFRKTDQQ